MNQLVIFSNNNDKNDLNLLKGFIIKFRDRYVIQRIGERKD